MDTIAVYRWCLCGGNWDRTQEGESVRENNGILVKAVGNRGEGSITERTGTAKRKGGEELNSNWRVGTRKMFGRMEGITIRKFGYEYGKILVATEKQKMYDEMR
jgi:hypothetical protein